MDSRARAVPGEALSGGPLISITGLISLLLLFPLPSYLPSPPPLRHRHRRGAKGALKLAFPTASRYEMGPTLRPFHARNLELPLASRIALLFVSSNSIPIADCFLFARGLNCIRRDTEGPHCAPHARVCELHVKCRRDINPQAGPKLPARDYKEDGNAL